MGGRRTTDKLFHLERDDLGSQRESKGTAVVGRKRGWKSQFFCEMGILVCSVVLCWESYKSLKV